MSEAGGRNGGDCRLGGSETALGGKKMNLRIPETAIRDLESGHSFYDRQEKGVGDYLKDCLISGIESLILYAGTHRKVFGYHRMLPRRFPYAVYYRMEGQNLVIHRVLDCRRDPVCLRGELSGR